MIRQNYPFKYTRWRRGIGRWIGRQKRNRTTTRWEEEGRCECEDNDLFKCKLVYIRAFHIKMLVYLRELNNIKFEWVNKWNLVKWFKIIYVFDLLTWCVVFGYESVHSLFSAFHCYQLDGFSESSLYNWWRFLRFGWR